jgi:hypothetical protein
MASLLAIDWDQQQLHLIAARTQRKRMQVEWAADWDMTEELNVRSAEAIGKRLRDFLKAEHVAAGSAIIAIGREKVILKDIRFPAVSASEEPALVRFQATKDVTDAPDALEIDYTCRGNAAGGEKQAVAVLARRDVLNAVRALCRGAGLKLIGVAPRPFGAPCALERTLQAGGGTFAGDAVLGVLTVGQRWAELCLFRGHELLLARSLPTGPVLVGEVKRSLAVFAAQNGADPRLAGPRVLYVFGNGHAPAPALAAALPCPVEVVSPLTIADGVAPREEHQASMAGAVGLAQRWAITGGLPVNLAVAKKAQVRVSPTRRRWLLYGAAAGLLLAVGIGAMYITLSGRRSQIQKLNVEKMKLDDELRALAQDRADIDGLKEWDQTTISWLDELYDLTARFPYEKGFRVNHLSVEAIAAKKGAKDSKEGKESKDAPVVARLRITGVTTTNKDAKDAKDSMVQHLRDAIGRDTHLKATIEKWMGGTHEFTIKIDVTKQPAAKYETVLVLPPDAARAAAAGKFRPQRDDEGDDE